MSVVCSRFGEDERCAQEFGGKTGERDHFEDLDIEGGDNTKIYVQEVEWEHGMDSTG
jgi:hypothetical protein